MQLQRAMAAEAEAAREARAKVLIVPFMMMLTFENPLLYSQVIAADGEQKAARALKVSLIIFTGCLLLMFFLLSLMIESAKNQPNKFRSYAQFCLH